MNWPRGLFRLWLVLTVLWIAAMAWTERDRLCWAAAPADRRLHSSAVAGPLVLARLDETLVEETYRSLVDCMPPKGRSAAWWRSREPVLLVMVGPPIGAFLIGCALLWVGRGFRLTR